NKQVTKYCYNIKERDTAITELGSHAEVTRFKGLGEISPGEFGKFIGPDMRLISVDVQTLKNIPSILEFYMGKNTPERREYIMKHLIREL
ncbi:MAG TPA: type IIA DNA topoisomerase subunit B, partial [Spirochaetales bacterium]|nr:type IIA DNA topoisomerase subunit B [Spirochaetales bacterium]